MRIKAIIVLGMGIALAGAAMAAVDAKQAIPQRQAHMKEMGRLSKAINDGLRAGSQGATFKGEANRLAALAAGLPKWFPAGTGPETGVKTAAKPDIWAKRADFSTKALALAVATRGLAGAARGGDQSAFEQQVRQVGEACKACHTVYKTKS